jgi:twitching motility two-component system response regulator PilH
MRPSPMMSSRTVIATNVRAWRWGAVGVSGSLDVVPRALYPIRRGVIRVTPPAAGAEGLAGGAILESRVRNTMPGPLARPGGREDDERAAAPLTVLLVDDVWDTLHMYETYLRFVGTRVVTASDGVSALGLVASASELPDAIVLDLSMPQMTGWQVLERLRSDPRTRRIPVLVLSGLGERRSALAAGADAYLEKPCLPDRLFAEVLRLLRAPDTPSPQ